MTPAWTGSEDAKHVEFGNPDAVHRVAERGRTERRDVG
jgi:hypothetical protein